MPKVNIPSQYLCPRTQKLMQHPVSTSDDQVFEEAAIKAWLQQHDTNPITGNLLANKQLTPNASIQQKIVDFVKENQMLIWEDLFEEAALGEDKLLHIYIGFIDLTKRNNEGLTLLHVAAENGNTPTVKFLLENEAEINVKRDNSEYLSQLQQRTRRRNTNNFNLRVSHEEARKNQTPLHLASIQGHVDVVQLLIKQGADITLPDNSGITPFHAATKSQSSNTKQVLEIFMHEAIKLNIWNDVKDTILQSAQEHPNKISELRNFISEKLLELKLTSQIEELKKTVVELQKQVRQLSNRPTKQNNIGFHDEVIEDKSYVTQNNASFFLSQQRLTKTQNNNQLSSNTSNTSNNPMSYWPYIMLGGSALLLVFLVCVLYKQYSNYKNKNVIADAKEASSAPVAQLNH